MNVSEIKVILKLREILGDDPEKIRQWLHLNLNQFDGRTALQLIRAGRSRDVIAYLEAAIIQMHKEDAEKNGTEGVIIDEEIPATTEEVANAE